MNDYPWKSAIRMSLNKCATFLLLLWLNNMSPLNRKKENEMSLDFIVWIQWNQSVSLWKWSESSFWISKMSHFPGWNQKKIWNKPHTQNRSNIYIVSLLKMDIIRFIRFKLNCLLIHFSLKKKKKKNWRRSNFQPTTTSTEKEKKKINRNKWY